MRIMLLLSTHTWFVARQICLSLSLLFPLLSPSLSSVPSPFLPPLPTSLCLCLSFSPPLFFQDALIDLSAQPSLLMKKDGLIFYAHQVLYKYMYLKISIHVLIHVIIIIILLLFLLGYEGQHLFTSYETGGGGDATKDF